MTYSDSFGVEHIQKKLKKFIDNKKIKTNIFRMQIYNVWILLHWIIDFRLKGKSLLDDTNLFSPSEYKKNDKIILNCFQYILKRLK